MPHDNEPESESLSEPKPINRRQRRAMWKRIGIVAVVSAGGLVTFALLSTPTHCRGASLSARLEWQQRKQQVRQAIECAPSEEAAATADQPGATNGGIETSKDVGGGA